MKTTQILTIVVLTLLVACKQTQHPATEVTAQSAISSAHDNTPVSQGTLSEFKFFVSKLDTLDVKSVGLAAQKFNVLLKDEDVSARDSAFVVFNTFYEKLDANLNEVHETDTTDYLPLVVSDIEVPVKLKEYNKLLRENGFEVSLTEGVTYIKQDRNFIEKWFYPHVSTTMKEYLLQLNKENKEGFADDAGLIINPKEFVDRTIWWGKFIQSNPSFILLNKAEEDLKYYLTILLEGMDNTPVMSYEKEGEVNEYFRDAYLYLQNEFPASQANKVVNPYFKALQQGDAAKAKSLLNDYRSKGYIIDFSQYSY